MSGRLTGFLHEGVPQSGGDPLQQAGDVHLADAEPLTDLPLGEAVSVAQPEQQALRVLLELLERLELLEQQARRELLELLERQGQQSLQIPRSDRPRPP